MTLEGRQSLARARQQTALRKALESGVVQTKYGGVSTAFPESYLNSGSSGGSGGGGGSGSSGGSGVVMTEQGGVSTAFPEAYTPVKTTPTPSSTIKRTTILTGSGLVQTSSPLSYSLLNPEKPTKESSSSVNKYSSSKERGVSFSTQAEAKLYTSSDPNTLWGKTKRTIAKSGLYSGVGSYLTVYSPTKAFKLLGLGTKATGLAGTKAGAFVLKKTGSQALQRTSQFLTRAGVSGGAGVTTFKSGMGITKAKATEEEKELAKKLGKDKINQLMRTGGDYEFSGYSKGTNYKQSVEDFYKEQGFSKEEAKSLSEEAIKNPETFYLNLGYSGDELTEKVNFAKLQKNKPLYKRIGAEWIPAGRLIIDPKENEKLFLEGVRVKAKELNLSPTETKLAEKYALRLRKGGELSSLATAFTLNVGSESIGQVSNLMALKGFSAPVSKAGLKSAGRSFLGTFPAGVFEGAGIEFSLQKGRFEKTNIKDISKAGLFGGASAGAIQGAIIGTSFKYPRISRGLELGAYFTDPLEKPADIVEAGISKSFSRVSGVPRTQIFLTDTRPQTKNRGTISFSDNAITKQTENINKNINSNLKNTIFETSKTPTSSRTNFFTDTNSKISTNIKLPTEQKIPVKIKENLPIFENVFTSTKTATSTPVNTLVPRMVLPPPVPLSFPSGFGGGGRGRGKGVKFINELAIGKQLLSGFSGFGGRVPVKTFKPPKVKSKSKKSKRGTRQGFIQFPRLFF